MLYLGICLKIKIEFSECRRFLTKDKKDKFKTNKNK